MATQPASFKGIGFFVQEVRDSGFEPEIQVHQFPYGDYPWVEFFGSKPHTIELSGYITSADAYITRDALRAAITEKSSGPLVHPSLGTLTVACVNSAFSESGDHRGIIGVSLVFVECASSTSTTTTASAENTQASLSSTAQVSASAFSDSYQNSLDAYAQQGSTVTTGVAQDIGTFFSALTSSLVSPTSAVRSVTGLDYLFGGSYTLGRYAQNPLSVPVTVAQGLSPQSIVASCVGQILNTASASRGAMAASIAKAQLMGELI